jgi:hypothetical protein
MITDYFELCPSRKVDYLSQNPIFAISHYCCNPLCQSVWLLLLLSAHLWSRSLSIDQIYSNPWSLHNHFLYYSAAGIQQPHFWHQKNLNSFFGFSHPDPFGNYNWSHCSGSKFSSIGFHRWLLAWSYSKYLCPRVLRRIPYGPAFRNPGPRVCLWIPIGPALWNPGPRVCRRIPNGPAFGNPCPQNPRSPPV